MAINKTILFVVLLSVIAGCGVKDDLLPSGKDKRPAVQLNVTGDGVGQMAPDFTVSDSRLLGLINCKKELFAHPARMERL